MAIKTNPTDEDSRKLAKNFCDYVVHLKALHHTCKELFEDDQALSLMEQTARRFFLDINSIMINHFLLEVAKITDPSQSKRGIRQNFSVANIRKSINWPRNVSDELQRLSNLANTFRQYILEARNKLIAHYDKETYLSGTALGGFPEQEDEKLMDTLEEMANVFHQACFGSIFGAISVRMPGDVHDLKKALRQAVAFKKLLAESRGDELIRLDKYLNNREETPVPADRD